MTEATATTKKGKSEPVICPGCLKPQRNIKGHIKAGCPGRPPEDAAVGAISSLSLPPEFMHAMEEIANGVQEAQKMAKSAADRTDAAVKIVPDVVSKCLNESLPAMIDQMLTARLDQLAAQLQANPAVGGPGIPPAGGGGKLGEISGILQALAALGIKIGGGAAEAAPANALLAQMEQMASLATALDKIRGVNQPGQTGANMTPKTALEWAKWGHSLGKKGAPEPDFDVSKVVTPPGQQT